MKKRYGHTSIGAAALLAIAVLPGQLAARTMQAPAAASPARKVVLMDFAAPVADPAAMAVPGGLGASGDGQADVAGTMATAFAGGARAPSGSLDQSPVLDASPAAPSAAALPNPFITRAVGFIPPVPASYAGGSCAGMTYLPDYSHGRSVEDRRRVIYPLMYQAACEQGLPIGLFDALIMQESRYNHAAVSRKGALGLAQLMPETARHLGTNPYTIMENLRGGARYLRQQLDRFGRYDLALAAYNAGPERVARFGRVPAITETVGYVRNISANWNHAAGVRAGPMITPIAGRRAQLIFMAYNERPSDGPR